MVTDRLTDRLTGSQTEMQHTDPVQYTVLGWVKNLNYHEPPADPISLD